LREMCEGWTWRHWREMDRWIGREEKTRIDYEEEKRGRDF
jgi:hypothetical protein